MLRAGRHLSDVNPRKLWPALAVAAVLILALLSGAGLLGLRAQSGLQNQDGQDLATVLEVIGVVKTHYLEPVSTLDLLAAYMRTGTINGMLKEVLKDPYTRYMSPAVYRQMQIEYTGQYAGIGIYIGIKEDRLTVIAPIPGTPAARAGLRAGDVIEAVDGRPAAEMSQDEASSRIRGRKGTPVRLTILRNGERFEVEIIRDDIEVPAVPSVQMLADGIGYVRLLQFSEKAASELDAALEQLERQGYQGLILDLRNNPGGLLSAAVDVANLFLSRGPIVHIVGRSGQRQTITASPFRTHPAVPMVVLVNKGTASASEILAGALRDRGLATLVGTPTFGKGLVQTVIPLRRGDAVSVTTQKYQTAGGYFIGEQGLAPDVRVAVPPDLEEAFPSLDGVLDRRDVQLQKAIEVAASLVTRAARRSPSAPAQPAPAVPSAWWGPLRVPAA